MGEAVRAKELAEQKAKKKSIPKQDDDKFDALGNKIETAVAAADIDRDYVKKLTKQLKALKERVKKGDVSAEDEMYEVEEQLDKANAILKKEKEAAKKEKEAAKALAKAAKKPKAKKQTASVWRSSRPHMVVASPAYSSFSPPPTRIPCDKP